MKFDWEHEFTSKGAESSYLGGHFGHATDRMRSAYFIDRHYADKMGAELTFRWDAPADIDHHSIKVVGLTVFSPSTAGPDAHTVHGGAVATQLDNLCGFTLNGLYMTGCRTANLNINYRHGVPTGMPVAFRCKIDRIEGRKHFISAAFLDAESVLEKGFWGEKGQPPKVLTECTALMIHAARRFNADRVGGKH
jgi:acyl-coenzyme A thioesterase PaaI-like protein